MDEAIEYLKEVNINDYVSVHILYYDTLSGLSAGLEQSVNKVDYSQLTDAFPTSSLNGKRHKGGRNHLHIIGIYQSHGRGQ